MANPELIIKIVGNSDRFRSELNKIGKDADAANQRMAKQAKIAGFAFTAVAAGVGFTVTQFAKFETGLVGVSKTTNIVGKELAALGDSIQALSAKTGIASTELLGIAQSAGQLGVKGSDNILKFTETVAKLGTASDLSGDAAATSLARLINVTGGAIEEVDVLASVIVRLGNNFAATESEITFTAQEIAKAGAQFGVTAEKAVALSAAFVSLGVQPELARSTVLQTLVKIKQAIDEGGDSLRNFQAITGLTGDQLKKTFEEDATEVFRQFLIGLNQSGGDATRVLDQLGLSNTRLLSTLPTLAKGINIVNDALEQQADESKNATALQNEFEAANKTTAQSLNRLKASFNNLAVDIGEKFAPVVGFAFDAMAEDIDEFGQGLKAIGTIFQGIVQIVGQSISLLIGSITSLVAESLKKVAEFALFVEQTGNKFGLGLDFTDFIGDVGGKSITLEAEANAKLKQGAEFFDGEAFQEAAEGRLDALKTAREQERTIEQDHLEQLQEINTAAKETAEEEGTRDIFSMTDEEFDESIEAFADRLQSQNDIEAELLRERLDNAETEAERRKIIEGEIINAKSERFKAEEKFDQAIVDSGFQALNAILGDNKAARTALLIAEKAFAISKILVNAQAAAALAIATIPPPAGEVVAAERIAAGNLMAGIVAAAAIPSVIGSLSAREGGIVPGGFGGGDRILGLLEPGEIIVPQKFNPLSPNFDDSFGGLGGGSTVQLNIDLTDRASQFITVNQREDTKLGIQR